VINTIVTLALPRGSTLYEVWFGRKLPTDFLDHRESTRRARVALGGEVKSNENSGSEGGEDSFFAKEGVEQEEVAKEMILSELTKRVTEHTRK
jgi:hypothetical protein